MMMSILKYFPRLLSIRSMWLTLYLVKLTLSVLIILPFYMASNSALSPSRFSESLLGAWDLSVLMELIQARGEAIPALIMTVIMTFFSVVFIHGCEKEYQNSHYYNQRDVQMEFK